MLRMHRDVSGRLGQEVAMIFENADFSNHASHLEIKVNGSQADLFLLMVMS